MEVDGNPPAVPEAPPLEAALAAYEATHPEDAKLLKERIIAIKKREEDATSKLASLEERRVDEDILKDQLSQLQAYLSTAMVDRFHVKADTVAGQLASDKPAIVANAAQRVIAACNAHFMTMGSEVAGSKRSRVASPPPPAAAAAAPEPAITASPAHGSDALKRALAAMY